MKKIKKYILEMNPAEVVEITGLMQIVSAQMQGSRISVFTIVDDEVTKVDKVEFLILSERQNAEKAFVYTFLNTVSMSDDQLMWHVFYKLLK